MLRAVARSAAFSDRGQMGERDRPRAGSEGRPIGLDDHIVRFVAVAVEAGQSNIVLLGTTALRVRNDQEQERRDVKEVARVVRLFMLLHEWFDEPEAVDLRPAYQSVIEDAES